ncbi:MAG: hypothetical protein Q9201_007153, partial [Fulgogasparrea decipioides]
KDSSTALPDPLDSTAKSSISQKHILQFRDIPEAGNRRPVTSRLVADIPLTGGDAAAFLSSMEYTHVSTYHLQGHRLTHNNISLLLFQPALPAAPVSASELTPIESTQFILEASLRVADGTKPDQMAKGVKELMALKEMLRGSVELECVERGALDTRVR